MLLPLAWRWLLVPCLLGVLGVETLLLGIGTGFLTTGYNVAHIGSLAMLAAFVALSMVMDLWLVLGIWALLVPLLRWLRASRFQIWCAAGMTALGIPVVLAALRYNVHAVLGDMASLVLLRQFSRLDSPAIAAQMLDEIPILGVLAFAGGAAASAVFVVAGRLEPRLASARRSFELPSVRALWVAWAVLTLLGTFLLGTPSLERLSPGMARKTSASLLSSLGAAVSDVDGDGFGLFAQPPDPAPFDASIHPYALDRPGNGVDENGVGGDHPADVAAGPPAGELSVEPPERPHVLLVYLESFRADLLQQRLHGREITPFLNELAREGASSQQAYVHSPWTLASRAHLFSGQLVSAPGNPTLIDDFQALGYTVAWFSGQDDSYGDSVRVLGADRADVFYDARSDIALRTSRSTAPASLQVSWRTLTRRILEFLETVDGSQPLFLYANVVDTHYPYTNADVDPILDVEPLDRSGIRSHRARQVWEAYANTAANVDRAVERIVETFRKRIAGASHAILVTADHGQSFYENGLLGHGQSLDGLQTRVPFIVWGLGGEWPEPLAPTDVRSLLLRNLGRERPSGPPRARFVPQPDRKIFQYVSALERPSLVALRGLDGRLQYEFWRGRLARIAPGGTVERSVPEARPDLLESVIWRWEREQRRAAALARPAP